MAAYIQSLQNLADQFMKLNGVGRKSSQRMAFSVLDMSGEEAAAFAQALGKTVDGIAAPIIETFVQRN